MDRTETQGAVDRRRGRIGKIKLTPEINRFGAGEVARDATLTVGTSLKERITGLQTEAGYASARNKGRALPAVNGAHYWTFSIW